MTWGRRIVFGALLCGGGLLSSCATSVGGQIGLLAEKDPLPYSVLVTGGAFLDPGNTDRQAGLLASTFAPLPGSDEGEVVDGATGQAKAPEVVDLLRFRQTLESARVFVATASDETTPRIRRQLARQSGPLSADAAALRRLLARAAAGGTTSSSSSSEFAMVWLPTKV